METLPTADAQTGPPPESSPPRRLRIGIGAVVVLVLVVLSATVGIVLLQGQALPGQTIPFSEPAGSADAWSDDSASSGRAAQIYVHVLGEVAAPGLYVLSEGARVAEAIASAGGTLATADLQSVNLARELADGEQLIVHPVGSAGAASAGGAAGGDGLIDLNTADAATLEQLPRIGPALAERIVEWREANGRFSAVEDLLAVSGIGEKLLAGIRGKVRV